MKSESVSAHFHDGPCYMYLYCVRLEQEVSLNTNGALQGTQKDSAFGRRERWFEAKKRSLLGSCMLCRQAKDCLVSMIATHLF